MGSAIQIEGILRKQLRLFSIVTMKIKINVTEYVIWKVRIDGK